MKYLTEYFDAEFSALLKEVGAFYAFSGKQFDESSKAGVQYSNLSTGLICPKGKEKYLLDNMYKIVQNAIVKDYEENGIKIIEREYFNHETQISMDYQPALDELKPYMLSLIHI